MVRKDFPGPDVRLDCRTSSTSSSATGTNFEQGTHGAAEACVFRRTIRRWQFSNLKEDFTSEVLEELTWPSEEDHFCFHNTTDQTRDVVRCVVEGLPSTTRRATRLRRRVSALRPKSPPTRERSSRWISAGT